MRNTIYGQNGSSTLTALADGNTKSMTLHDTILMLYIFNQTM